MLPKRTLWHPELLLHTPGSQQHAPVPSSLPVLDAPSTSSSFYETLLGQTLAHEISCKDDATDFVKRELSFEENDHRFRRLRKDYLDVALCAYLLCLEGTPPSTLLSVVVLASIFIKRLESVASLPSMQTYHHQQQQEQQQQQLYHLKNSRQNNDLLGVLEPLLPMASNNPRERAGSVDHYSTVAYDEAWQWKTTTPGPLEGVVPWAPFIESDFGTESSSYDHGDGGGGGGGGGSQFTFWSHGSSDRAAGTPSSVNSLETTASMPLQRHPPTCHKKTGSLQELHCPSLTSLQQQFREGSSLFSQLEPHRTLRSTKLMLSVHHAKNILDLILRLVPFLYLAYIYLEDRPRHSIVGRELDLDENTAFPCTENTDHGSRTPAGLFHRIVQESAMRCYTACKHDQKQNKQNATAAAASFVTVTHDVAHRNILSVAYRARSVSEGKRDDNPSPQQHHHQPRVVSLEPRSLLVSLDSTATQSQNRSPPVFLFPPDAFTEIRDAVHDARRKYYRFDDVVRRSNRNIAMVLRVLGFHLHAAPEEWMGQLQKMLHPCPSSVRQRCKELLEEMHF